MRLPRERRIRASAEFSRLRQEGSRLDCGPFLLNFRPTGEPGPARFAVIAAKKNLRLLTTKGLPDPAEKSLAFKQVAGGFLVQDRDCDSITVADLKVVTKRAPTEAELADLLFAWKVAKHVKSNAIVYVKDGATVGVGAGQMSRVDSTRIAARKAGDMAEALGLQQSPTIGSVVASDAFFPFPDGLLTAAEAGATAVIQPGGSMNDDKVIAAADEAGLAMVFTGQRHFGTDMRFLSLTALIVFVLDQLSKLSVIFLLGLPERGEIDVVDPLLNFRWAENRGVNFGLFSNGAEVVRWVLILVALGISGWVLWWLKREAPGRLAWIAGGLLVGGALGNVVDRVELQTLMWDKVGLARTREELVSTQGELQQWRSANIENRLFTDWEDANLLVLATAVTEAAIARTESRGGHTRDDFPKMDSGWRHDLVVCRTEGDDPIMPTVVAYREKQPAMREDLLELFELEELGKYFTDEELAQHPGRKG